MAQSNNNDGARKTDSVAPPVSSTSYAATPTNGEASKPREKEEDHYGFLYSISEKDKH